MSNELFVRRITGDALVKNERKTFAKDSEITFSFKNLSFSYTDVKAESDENNTIINNVSFDLYKGSLTALTGPSGAGKSTLLELGSGLLTQDSGDVFCNIHPALAQQNCSAALFEAFAADDVAFGPRNEGVSGKKLISIVKTITVLKRI